MTWLDRAAVLAGICAVVLCVMALAVWVCLERLARRWVASDVPTPAPDLRHVPQTARARHPATGPHTTARPSATVVDLAAYRTTRNPNPAA